MGNKTCLVVDDSRVIRKVARRMLEEIGFAVDEAGDGKEALERCAQSLPQSILLDWNMPVMNGLDFLKALRQTPGGDGPVVVFCTTENDIEHIQAALEAGASEYIMKPFDREILEAKLASVGVL
jgi:two-component system chemotaxis response regulator CheY